MTMVDVATPATVSQSVSRVVVDLQSISYTYEGEGQPVLNDISFQVDDGEFVLILGPSGCGKSTLLQLFNGTIPHTLKGALAGEASICGHALTTTKVATFATDVGMVFQDPDAQIICTRVRDEVCFGLENLCRPAAEIMEQQVEALRLVGLDGFGDRSVFDLSGGQKQRVSIAAVLAVRPRLLVLDEPTANLDPAGMADVFVLLHALHKAGTTIVMVEHRVDELADRVSRVIMMDRGRMTFDGPPREAFSQPRAARSEEGDVVPVSAWFPQAAEFALALGTACGVPIQAKDMPLNVAEAVTLGERFIGVAAVMPSVPAASMSSPETTPLLRVQHLSFGYDRVEPILDDVNFDLGRGRLVAICGRNGSGKTTLARLVMGINDAPRKTIFLNGKDLSALGPKEISAEVGYVFQNPDHQFVTDRVWDEVAYGLTVRGYADDAIRMRVDEVLGIVDLARYAERSPFSLSLGERRRLSVATMLVLEPRLLILDEPTIGQDHERAQLLMGLMVRLRERYNTTVLMITHDVRLVAEWADRVLVLSRGRLLFDGTPENMFADEALLAAGGLLTPPVFDISRRIAAALPAGPVRPTLSVPALVDAIVKSRKVAA
ncbi:ABC transporter ATP-binding protein [Lichenifustis flavocetrariae]|uniref:Energy-coupling factor ABC transporter ATP-binding protein n=1 Tax=Lichenifustis flavocetrariae TaxID=2949735 RepID=A0AA41Z0B8_9HYPH|nr:ABC transporter ATP-binding protein [Lichenifustis flavocetrariae]MCW6510616.1 energy-coupling factor ABC transporter ATP-binding protein [Lichenifustis flavocetrariae]